MIRIGFDIDLFLGGGFKYLLFSPIFGEHFQSDEYFSDGLKPPTRFYMICKMMTYSFFTTLPETTSSSLKSQPVGLLTGALPVSSKEGYTPAFLKLKTSPTNGYQVVTSVSAGMNCQSQA